MKRSEFICPVDDCCECNARDCWQDHCFCDDCEEEILKGESRYRTEIDCKELSGKWVKRELTICEACYVDRIGKPPTIYHRRPGAHQLNKSLCEHE